MKEVITISILILNFGCTPFFENTSKCVDYSSIEVIDGKFCKNNKPYTGCLKKYNNENVLVLKVNIVKGVLQGPFTEYKSGKIHRKGEYKNNNFHGKVITYYDNGEIEQISECDSTGKLHGTTKRFSKNGDLLEVINYSHGQKDGLYKAYYDDGSLMDSLFYRYGSLNGTSFSFYKNGKLRSFDSFSNDKGNGLNIKYIGGDHNYFIWGRVEHGKSINEWYYKLRKDSCFIRSFDQYETYTDSMVECSDIVPPPIKTENYNLK